MLQRGSSLRRKQLVAELGRLAPGFLYRADRNSAYRGFKGMEFRTQPPCVQLRLRSYFYKCLLPSTAACADRDKQRCEQGGFRCDPPSSAHRYELAVDRSVSASI